MKELTRDDLLFNANKCVYGPSLGLHIEVEGSRVSDAAGKVDVGDLVESDVEGRLVYKDKATLEWIQEACSRLVRTSNRPVACVTTNNRGEEEIKFKFLRY